MGAFLVSITAACLLYSCTGHIKEQCDKSRERIGRGRRETVIKQLDENKKA
jgi:hypothetical protein